MSASNELILLILDVFGSASPDALRTLLPVHGAFHTEALSQLVATRTSLPLRSGQPIPFAELSEGVHDLVARARERAGDRSVSWAVAGLAPLPLFAQLGFELSAWARPLTLLNQRKDGTWDVLRLDGTVQATGTDVFETKGLGQPVEATGRIAVFVSTVGNAAPSDAIRAYLSEQGETLAGIVDLRAPGGTILSADNVERAAQQLAECFSSLATTYPHCLNRGAAVFVAGPASLAILAGRAANGNMIREVWFPNHDAGVYRNAVVVPLPRDRVRPLDPSASASEERAAVLRTMSSALCFLQQKLQAAHLPATHLVPNPEELIRGLRELQLPSNPQPGSPVLELAAEVAPDGFALKAMNRRLVIGEALCDALRGVFPAVVDGVTRQLVVHELFHIFQNLTHGNYRQVGRAGRVLEEVDFWADVYAVRALSALRAEVEGRRQHEVVQQDIDLALRGVEVFDRAEQGDRIDQLYERRLRRYLIWWLQRARAATLREAAAVDAMFETRLVVELAPLAGSLDGRGDKLIVGRRADTELFVACGARFARIEQGANVDPREIIDHVREFRRELLSEVMDRIVEREGKLLVPWAALDV